MIRFAVVADNHLYIDAPDDGPRPRLQTHGVRVLDVLVDELNATELDFIVHVGDQVCGGSGSEISHALFLRSLAQSAQTLGRLRAPLYVVPGNHDCDVVAGGFDDFAGYWSMPAPLSVVNVAPRLRLALAHVYGHSVYDAPEGVWDETLDEQLRAAAVAAEADGCALVLALHTWVLPHEYADCDDDPMAGLLREADRLQQTLRDAPSVVIALAGHRHRNRITDHDGAAMIDTASLVAYPFGYREIELHGDGRLVVRFRQLPVNDLIDSSYGLSNDATNRQLLGTPADRDTDIILPRLRAIWK